MEQRFLPGSLSKILFYVTIHEQNCLCKQKHKIIFLKHLATFREPLRSTPHLSSLLTQLF
jgi:hypothetical protein